MCRSDLKPSPLCSMINSKQDSVVTVWTVTIFSIRSAPKLNGITLAGCDRRNGQNSNWSNDDDWPRAWGRSGLGTFLGTLNHKFRFRSSGNPTKHMPIGYWSLWGQPMSVTSGDLRWPWNSYMMQGQGSQVVMYWHQSHQLSPFKSIAPRQVAFTDDFAEILSRVAPLMTS